MTEAAIAIACAAIAFAACVLWLLLRGWPASLSLTAKTKDGLVSLGAGLELSKLSVSAAAILGGPGVVVVQLGSRRLWQRNLERVTVEAAATWLEGLLDAPPAREEKGRLARLATRAKDALLARTDLGALPSLGTRILLDLRDPSLSGSVLCGFADPAITGKTAAVLFPLAGMLAPLGAIDLRFDWSGRTVLDVDVEGGCKVVPARIARQTAWFAWNHVHRRPRLPTGEVSHTLPA
ncbi:MAG: hypothetical protein JST00_21305 [Deltaproteobacteria bacterium]|nr:hypothetical protein [Deltaproteobacteria bacterium]